MYLKHRFFLLETFKTKIRNDYRVIQLYLVFTHTDTHTQAPSCAHTQVKSSYFISTDILDSIIFSVSAFI